MASSTSASSRSKIFMPFRKASLRYLLAYSITGSNTRKGTSMKVLIKESPRLLGRVKKTVRRITEDLLTSLRLPDRDLSILFVDNKKIRDLNKQFFDKDYPTNVISFSYIDGLPSEVMGDIVIS